MKCAERRDLRRSNPEPYFSRILAIELDVFADDVVALDHDLAAKYRLGCGLRTANKNRLGRGSFAPNEKLICRRAGDVGAMKLDHAPRGEALRNGAARIGRRSEGIIRVIAGIEVYVVSIRAVARVLVRPQCSV